MSQMIQSSADEDLIKHTAGTMYLGEHSLFLRIRNLTTFLPDPLKAGADTVHSSSPSITDYKMTGLERLYRRSRPSSWP